jgi:hypothetical protein
MDRGFLPVLRRAGNCAYPSIAREADNVMKPEKPGGVVFLPKGKDVPASLEQLGKKLSVHGHQGMVFPSVGTSHDFGWELKRNREFVCNVVIAVFHPNDIVQFFDDYPLNWYVASGHFTCDSQPVGTQIDRLARGQAAERIMMGVVGVTQLVAGGAAVVLFSGGAIGDDPNRGLTRLTEQLAKVDILKGRDFFAFEYTDGAEMLTRFDWDRFLREWPKIPLFACARFEEALPETLLAFDILLQGYLAVRLKEAPWHELRAEFGLQADSNALEDARAQTATTSLFPDAVASRPYWFDSLAAESGSPASPFSSDLDFLLAKSPAAELPTPAKERFERCLLSGSSLNAAKALARTLVSSPTAADAVEVLATGHDGGALRLAYELVRQQGQAFGWTPVAHSPLVEDDCSSILLALFAKAHQELCDCCEAMQGAVPVHWSVERGK